MQNWSLPFIQSKLTLDGNFHCIRGWHAGNLIKTIIDEYHWMHKDIIYEQINGWTRGLCRVYDQAWPRQDDPQYFLIRYNYQDNTNF